MKEKSKNHKSKTKTIKSRDACFACGCTEGEVGPLLEQYDESWMCRACAQQSNGRF